HRRAIDGRTKEIPSGRSGARQTTGFQGQMTKVKCETVDRAGRKMKARNSQGGHGKGTAFPGASRKPVLRRKLLLTQCLSVSHNLLRQCLTAILRTTERFRQTVGLDAPRQIWQNQKQRQGGKHYS